jgi:hypothetical protein
MADIDVPIDIQQALDQWLADNPDAQKYVSKIWYVQEGTPVPTDCTHTLRLQSTVSDERALTVGVVGVPPFPAFLDALLAMIATQPSQ